MIGASRIVLAVGGGYLLGRTKKLKFAITVGGAVTGRQLPASATDLLRMGWKFVAASPELTRLRDAVRGRLLVAGRDAAIAAAGYQMEVLTGRLTARLELLEDSTGPDAVPGSTGSAVAAVTAEPATASESTPVDPGMAGEPITVVAPDAGQADEHLGSRASSNGHVQEGAPA